MAKITVHGGPSNADLPEIEEPEEVVETPAPAEEEPIEVVDDPEPTEAEPVPSEPAEEPAPERPADSASKAEWVAYVAAVTGLTEAEVGGSTKAQLIEIYGGAPDGPADL